MAALVKQELNNFNKEKTKFWVYIRINRKKIYEFKASNKEMVNLHISFV